MFVPLPFTVTPTNGAASCDSVSFRVIVLPWATTCPTRNSNPVKIDKHFLINVVLNYAKTTGGEYTHEKILHIRMTHLIRTTAQVTTAAFHVRQRVKV